MSDRLQEIRARLDLPGVWAAAGPQNAEFIDHAVGDIAWLLAEVERMRTENGTELLPDDSVAQGVTKQERDA